MVVGPVALALCITNHYLCIANHYWKNIISTPLGNIKPVTLSIIPSYTKAPASKPGPEFYFFIGYQQIDDCLPLFQVFQSGQKGERDLEPIGKVM